MIQRNQEIVGLLAYVDFLPVLVVCDRCNFPTVRLFFHSSYLTIMLTCSPIAPSTSLLRSGFAFDEGHFPSCHASALAEMPSELGTAWFAGIREFDPVASLWDIEKLLAGERRQQIRTLLAEEDAALSTKWMRRLLVIYRGSVTQRVTEHRHLTAE